MRKYLALTALLLVLALGLGGCAAVGGESDDAGEIRLPEPPDESENMILGESLSNSFSDVTLFFPNPDGTGFSTVTRSVRNETGQSLPEAAAIALLESFADTRMLSCEYTCGTVTVNLSIDARGAQSAQELLALETALGNTLLGIDGVQGVNVLFGGLCEGFFRLPSGVMTSRASSVAGAYAQIQAEHDRQSQQDSSPIIRSALLYFPTVGGDWLVPELAEIPASSEGFVVALIDALKAGPKQNGCAIASIPEGAELLDGEPVIGTLPNGERALSLNFSSTLANYLAFSGLAVWELAGSIALTACSFLPELDAVRIMVNGDPITMCELGDDIIHFPDGLIHRRDFAGRVGSIATLYLVDENNALQPVQRAVSMRSALSPGRLLTELFRCAGEAAAPPRFPLSENVYPEDLLGVQASGGIAKVNLSGNFYRACQSLNQEAERNLVYSMVETLCTLEGIRGVRFYVEGLPADTLAGHIYLRTVLLPNPGIVAAPVNLDR